MKKCNNRLLSLFSLFFFALCILSPQVKGSETLEDAAPVDPLAEYKKKDIRYALNFQNKDIKEIENIIDKLTFFTKNCELEFKDKQKFDILLNTWFESHNAYFIYHELVVKDDTETFKDELSKDYALAYLILKAATKEFTKLSVQDKINGIDKLKSTPNINNTLNNNNQASKNNFSPLPQALPLQPKAQPSHSPNKLGKTPNANINNNQPILFLINGSIQGIQDANPNVDIFSHVKRIKGYLTEELINYWKMKFAISTITLSKEEEESNLIFLAVILKVEQECTRTLQFAISTIERYNFHIENSEIDSLRGALLHYYSMNQEQLNNEILEMQRKIDLMACGESFQKKIVELEKEETILQKKIADLEKPFSTKLKEKLDYALCPQYESTNLANRFALVKDMSFNPLNLLKLSGSTVGSIILGITCFQAKKLLVGIFPGQPLFSLGLTKIKEALKAHAQEDKKNKVKLALLAAGGVVGIAGAAELIIFLSSFGYKLHQFVPAPLS